MSDSEDSQARRGGRQQRNADESPSRDRRSPTRVRDDQASGQGAASALSKWKMLERRRSIVPRRQQD